MFYKRLVKYKIIEVTFKYFNKTLENKKKKIEPFLNKKIFKQNYSDSYAYQRYLASSTSLHNRNRKLVIFFLKFHIKF